MKSCSAFFRTYTEKVWGGVVRRDFPPTRAAQRIKGLDLGVAVKHALQRSLGRKRKASPGRDVVKSLIDTFQLSAQGPGMMWDAAARKIRDRGGRLLVGRELRQLSYDANAKLWRIEVATSSTIETYTARHVISSAPVRELADCLAATPISLFHARALRYRDFLTVALMVKKPELFDDNWIYIHDPSVKVGRVQNFRSWSPEMVPDPA